MLLSKRTAVPCCMGMFFGIVLSPVMWLTLYDPRLHGAVVPICGGESQPGLGDESLGVTPSAPLPWTVGEKRGRGELDLSNMFGEFGRSQFNLSAEGGVHPPSSTHVRRKKMGQELAPRKLLFIGVVTAEKYLSTRATAINRTWGLGLTDLRFFSSHPANSSIDLPIITLPGINDTVYPPQRKVYHMLKYMHDHYIDEYDFFMRSDDDAYVKMDLLHELLEKVNPAQDIYMGCPGFGKAADKARIKLSKEEHYCMGGPGVIFSRSALRKLAPRLNTCLETVVVSYNEDVEVGRCVSKMLKIQCTWSWESTVIFWTDYKRILATPALYTDPNVGTAITLHPVKDPLLMYRIHQYSQELRLQRWLLKTSMLQEDIQRISQLVPKDMQHFQMNRWLWHDLGTNPPSRHKLTIWEYFNSTQLFLNYEHLPVLPLPEDVSKGINMALEVLIDHMNHFQSHTPRFLPPYHLFDGYMVTDRSSGIQYSLHLSVHKAGQKVPVEYRADVFLPFQGAGMATYQEATPLRQRTVHLIINAGRTADLGPFLNMYESICIRNKLGTHLHIVLFGNEGKARSQLADVVARHPRDLISSYEVMEGGFSHSSGYKHVADKLSVDDLLVMLDYNFVFTSEFIDHVRMNAVKGLQAYFPILFSYYKPELVAQYVRTSQQSTISADTGFFLRYNYQVVAIYKSDYDIINGITLSNAGGVAKNDDVRFVDKALHSSIYVMRGLEPFLRRKYLTRTCGSSSSVRAACMNSKADAIGSKKMLASLLIGHDLLDSV